MGETLTAAQVLAVKGMSSRAAAKHLGVGKTTVNKYRRALGMTERDSGLTDPVIELPNARILIIDIESKPHQAYVWGMWDQNVGLPQLIEEGGMICFAAKWLGNDETMFYSVQHDGQEAMVQAAHDLLSAADIVVTYNGDRYDIKRLNNEFLLAGMAPPAPFRSIDLFKVNKAQFDLPSRKLDYIVQRTELGEKTKHEGFGLWVACMAGDAEAWAKMEEYNRQDVTITEKLYVKLLPWLKNVPHMGMFSGAGASCPYCGHETLKENGTVATQVQLYTQYKCTNCEGWSRGNKPIQSPLATRTVR